MEKAKIILKLRGENEVEMECAGTHKDLVYLMAGAIHGEARLNRIVEHATGFLEYQKNKENGCENCDQDDCEDREEKEKPEQKQESMMLTALKKTRDQLDKEIQKLEEDNNNV